MRQPLDQRVKQSDAPCSVDRRTVLMGAGLVVGAVSCKSGGRGVGGGPSDEKLPPATSRAPTSLRGRAVGFQLAHEQFTMPELVRLGILAEEAGFDVVTASDHLQPWQANEGHSGQAWITLSAIGQRTHHIWLGTTVTCPTFRYNPAVVAQGFASLSALYPGRVFLGVGSGEAINEQAATGAWPAWAERSERLVDATELIRKAWSGQLLDYKGKYYAFRGRLYDPPKQPIPLLMAANGPKAMYRAGRYADGLITDSKTWKQHRGEFERGAKDGGRDRSGMPVFVEHYVVVGDESDARTAAQLWRFGPKAWKPYFNISDPRTIEERATAEIPLEQVYADWPIGTDSNIHVKAMNELFESGATEVNCHSGQPDQKRVVEFYGKEVLPRVRRG